MDISKANTVDLLREINRRQEEKNTLKDGLLVFGVIGTEEGSNFAEMFKVLKAPSDLEFVSSMMVRSRINSHRFYRGFYFKTDLSNFEMLNENFKEQNESFANSILENKKVEYIKL